MKPVVIGITGKACAGKNQYAKAFEELGARLIDVDRLGHQALEANKDRIIAEFGDSVADRGEIDRKALGAIVFSDPSKLKALEKISHPWMVARIERILAEETAEVIVLNAALLNRMGLDRLCSHILFITAPRCLRFRRCKARDGLSWRQFLKREASQRDISYQLLDPKAIHHRLWNWGSMEIIHRQVQRCCGRIGVKRCSRN